MQWYEKFKVGQEVKVVKKVGVWKFSNNGGCSWSTPDMDITIGKIYEIKTIDVHVGYQLLTEKDFPDEYSVGMNYWYPTESLEEINVKGRQLLFDFMQENQDENCLGAYICKS